MSCCSCRLSWLCVSVPAARTLFLSYATCGYTKEMNDRVRRDKERVREFKIGWACERARVEGRGDRGREREGGGGDERERERESGTESKVTHVDVHTPQTHCTQSQLNTHVRDSAVQRIVCAHCMETHSKQYTKESTADTNDNGGFTIYMNFQLGIDIRWRWVDSFVFTPTDTSRKVYDSVDMLTRV